jgi:DNA invertase Pin-like site-specific DNA recombinase
MRAALYARYSTELQREASIEDQFRQCERTAAANGFEIVARFEDREMSGGLTARPGYQAMLTAARGKEFDVIVAEDLSRLWRARAEFGMRSAELEDLGVACVFCTGDDTRRDGYGLVLGIKSAIAEHQRREISYRTRRGMEGLAAAGKSTGGRCYGLPSPKVSPERTAAEADTVRRVFRERQQGLGVREILAGLSRSGTPAPRGSRWSYNAVKRILANPRYAGKAIWGATQGKTRASDGRRGRPVMRPGGPLVTRDIPALVDPLEWGACNPGRVLV